MRIPCYDWAAVAINPYWYILPWDILILTRISSSTLINPWYWTYRIYNTRTLYSPLKLYKQTYVLKNLILKLSYLSLTYHKFSANNLMLKVILFKPKLLQTFGYIKNYLLNIFLHIFLPTNYDMLPYYQQMQHFKVLVSCQTIPILIHINIGLEQGPPSLVRTIG